MTVLWSFGRATHNTLTHTALYFQSTSPTLIKTFSLLSFKFLSNPYHAEASIERKKMVTVCPHKDGPQYKAMHSKSKCGAHKAFHWNSKGWANNLGLLGLESLLLLLLCVFFCLVFLWGGIWIESQDSLSWSAESTSVVNMYYYLGYRHVYWGTKGHSGRNREGTLGM